jgi:hypothetical protein
MIIFDPGGGEPMHWAVCFTRKSATPWANRLPIGTYKHVRAFGYVAENNTWVFFDPAINRTTIRVARGEAAITLIREFLYLADVLQMPICAEKKRAGTLPIFGWCAPAVAHLLGLPGALRVDTLFAHCLRHNGRALTTAPAAA